MLKKLLSLAAVAALGISANAEVVEDIMINYANYTSFPFYVMGYIPEFSDGVMKTTAPFYKYVKTSEATQEQIDASIGTETINGDECYIVPTEEPQWYQFFAANGNVVAGKEHTVTICAKASEEVTINMNFQWGWGDGQRYSADYTIPTEWAEIEYTYPEAVQANLDLVAQPGTSTALIEWKWIRVTHNETIQPVEWEDILVNGDASGEDAFNFWSKNYGKDLAECERAYTDDAHGMSWVVKSEDKVAEAWDAQFFIHSQREFAEGEIFKITFDYKAAKPAMASTQAHTTPTSYKHYEMLGDINFTTDWQTYSKQITVNASQATMQSIAFNLNELAEANTYYFDNVKWEVMKLDEGWFVAGDFNDWDLSNAWAFKWDDEEGCMVGEAGTEEKPASSIKISTKRGNDNAFNGACIKPDGMIESGGDWCNILPGVATKIALPEAGIWKIFIDEELNQIGFEKVDHSGIADVDVENVPAVYYNLQGIQVANPEAGNVYIVKRGDKATKTFVR